MLKEEEVEEIRSFISSQSDDTCVYIGSDSERTNINGEWFAIYTVVICVHIDSKHGCKVFGNTVKEKDYTKEADSPSLRLMNEVYKVAEVYLQLQDVLADRYTEIHLDLNPGKDYKSNQVVQQAIGYIKGVCNISPNIKPSAFAASYAADRLKFIKG